MTPSLTDKRHFNPAQNQVILPFALAIVQGKKMKKKCCKKYKKKGKRCSNCPGRLAWED
jgi:hypothetical protein